MHIKHRITTIIAGLALISQTCAFATEAIPPKTGEQAKATSDIGTPLTPSAPKAKNQEPQLTAMVPYSIKPMGQEEFDKLNVIAPKWEIVQAQNDGTTITLTGMKIGIAAGHQITAVALSPKQDLVVTTAAQSGGIRYILGHAGLNLEITKLGLGKDTEKLTWKFGDAIMIGTMPHEAKTSSTQASALDEIKTLDDLLEKIPATKSSSS